MKVNILYVQFFTRVDQVRPNFKKEQLEWIVSTSPVITHKDDASVSALHNSLDQIFDAVMVCNG